MSVNRQKTGKRKAPRTAFKPGQSGNPAGRPKVAEEFRARARSAVDEHVLSAWIQEVAARGDEWMRASENLAAYGYGRPSIAPEDRDAVKDGASRIFALLGGLSDASLMSLVGSIDDAAENE